jgi:CheY-like chemotaxis protein
MKTETRIYKEVTVLLVDDDDIDVMGVERALRKRKIMNPIVRAHDGLEALKLLRDPNAIQRPYLILMDINMPRMNGIEMLGELRRDTQLSTAVVFVLTTSKSDEDRMAAYQQHIAGYIVKDHVGDGFMHVVDMLDHYWRVAELPVAC